MANVRMEPGRGRNGECGRRKGESIVPPVPPIPMRQMARSASIFLISAIAFAGLSPLGQTFAQFMMVWQR